MAPDPIAFKLFGLEIRWYGILIALALVLGIAVAYFLAKYRNQREEEVINFAPFAVIAGVIGARLLHVLVNWSYYSRHLSYIFAFRRGGLAIQGTIVGGIIALLIFCRIRKLDLWVWLDILSPALVLGQAIGRWGNFFNQEAFGFPTSLPWGIYIAPENRPPDYAHAEYFHPTFFYESMANFLLFVLLVLMHRFYKKRPDRLPSGIIFTMYIGIYSVYRTFIEYFRIDSTYIGNVKVVYIINFIILIAAFLIANYLITKFKKHSLRR
ncbi:MAG: prolipoprotein diacylglyceryl transferase [Actinobacteria bacterium]|nr:prolipoprotein diacylglyceryl transferase [Actinomycetota bacterium]